MKNTIKMLIIALSITIYAQSKANTNFNLKNNVSMQYSKAYQSSNTGYFAVKQEYRDLITKGIELNKLKGGPLTQIKKHLAQSTINFRKLYCLREMKNIALKHLRQNPKEAFQIAFHEIASTFVNGFYELKSFASGLQKLIQ